MKIYPVTDQEFKVLQPLAEDQLNRLKDEEPKKKDEEGENDSTSTD